MHGTDIHLQNKMRRTAVRFLFGERKSRNHTATYMGMCFV